MRAKQLNAISSLVRFVVKRLPDSIRERRQILTAATDALPKGHSLRGFVRELSEHLDQHETARQKFPQPEEDGGKQ